MRSRLLAALPLLALTACTPDIIGMYEAEKSAALAAATTRPAEWEPDLVLQIAGPDFEDAVESSIKAALAKEQEPLVVSLGLGLEAKLRPVFSIEEASVKAADTCPSCLSFDAMIVGKAVWSLGPASGTVPLDVGAQGVFALEVTDGKVIEAVPRAVTAVRVRVTDLAGLQVNPSRQIQEWLTEKLSGRLPRIRVVELDTAGLPLLDLRLRNQGGAVRVEALTDVPGTRPVGPVEAPTEGVRVAISEAALTGLARRAAYDKGELTMDVYADPLALHVDGSAFTMDLRLWRLVGRGWYRDYKVYGDLSVEGGKVKLTAKRTEDIGHSRGAGLVDPLAALFQGVILESITDSVSQSLPATQRQDLGMVQLRAETTRVVGSNGALVVDGTLRVRAPDTASDAPQKAPGGR
jgi:hypothetical protein